MELLDAFRRAEVTPSEILEDSFARIDAVNPSVNAFTALDFVKAKQQAQVADAAYASGTPRALEGIPVAIKEIFAVEGMPFTGQSLTRKGVVADCDARVVAQLRDLGAVIVGTTRTHELAWGITSQHERLGGVCNPWQPDRVAGGSSAGSAVAVATGCVPLAVGTDTVCSVRLPAACCGIVGFKLTHSTLSLDGVLPLAPSFDTVGLLANSAQDIAYVLDALGVVESKILEVAPVVGVVRLAHSVLITDEQRFAYRDAQSALEEVGCSFQPVEWPHGMEVSQVFGTIRDIEALESHRKALGSWPDKRDLYGSDVRARLENAESVTDADRAQATIEFDRLRTVWNAALEKVDAVLLPSMSGKPSFVADADNVEINGTTIPFRDSVIPWTCSANLLGVPGCAIPIGPEYFQSVQLLGRRGEDASLLALAAAAQRALTITRVPHLQ